MQFCAVFAVLGYTYGQAAYGQNGLRISDYQIFMSKFDYCINKKLYICGCYSRIMVLFDRCSFLIGTRVN